MSQTYQELCQGIARKAVESFEDTARAGGLNAGLLAATSLLSDVQEMLAEGMTQEADRYVNAAKFLIISTNTATSTTVCGKYAEHPDVGAPGCTRPPNHEGNCSGNAE